MSYLKKINLFWVVIIFLAVLPSLYGVWHSGFFVSDDGNWMVIRFSAFYQALADGQFPVRFLDRLNYSYGYPVANFLYPGFMYIGVPLKIVCWLWVSIYVPLMIKTCPSSHYPITVNIL